MGGKRPQDFPTIHRSILFFSSAEQNLGKQVSQEMFSSLMIILQFFDMWVALEAEKNCSIVEHDPKCKYWGFFLRLYY